MGRTTPERRRRQGFVWAAVLLVIVGAVIAAHFALRVSPADHRATVRVGASSRDPHRPHLRLIVDDTLRAEGFLLKGRDLRGGGFHPYDSSYTQISPINGKCGTLADPNLSALTATADVSGRVVWSRKTGAEFLPSGFIFHSRAQAARAQALETAPDYVPCEVALIKQRYESAASLYIGGVPYTITGLTRHVIARTIDGVIVRGQQAVVKLTIQSKYTDAEESSFIFFRYGRALFELRTSTPWGGGNLGNGVVERRDWRDAINATARLLRRSGF